MHRSSFAVRRFASALLLAAPLATPGFAVTPAPAQKTSGGAKVNGKPLDVAHAYLFHAPDAWEEKEVNAVVVLTAKPLDEGKLRQAKTLADALDNAPVRIVVEVRAGNKANLSICHPEFGDGMCYSTTIHGPDEWQEAAAAPTHLAGHVQTFTGEEQTVLAKYRLFYEFSFDAAPVADFQRRR